MLTAIQAAQAPKRFTTQFLESLGFKSTSDRLVIGVLKALGFLKKEDGTPTERYYHFLDQTQSGRILAEGIREAYADLFQINKKAQDLSPSDIKNKLKTLTQGQSSDDVLEKMASTFKALCANADFSGAPAAPAPAGDAASAASDEVAGPAAAVKDHGHPPLKLGGLVYTIQIQLPESRDPTVYDALFKSLKEHLLR
jgi:hypothetical protein